MHRDRNVYVSWFGPLPPARQQVFNVFAFTLVPLLTLAAAIWACSVFPYHPTPQQQQQQQQQQP